LPAWNHSVRLLTRCAMSRGSWSHAEPEDARGRP
jgi:hypothetical protein